MEAWPRVDDVGQRGLAPIAEPRPVPASHAGRATGRRARDPVSVMRPDIGGIVTGRSRRIAPHAAGSGSGRHRAARAAKKSAEKPIMRSKWSTRMFSSGECSMAPW